MKAQPREELLKALKAEFIKPLAEQTALGRIGNPEDIAKVIVNLLSDDFAWVTAQDIDVSGGFLL